MTTPESLAGLLDQAAVAHYRKTADDLEALQTRLGRDGLSMDEWNGLVAAIHELRVEAHLREDGTRHTPSPQSERIEKLEAALRQFVDSAAHTRVFLTTREKMHPAGVGLYDDDVEYARQALSDHQEQPK